MKNPKKDDEVFQAEKFIDPEAITQRIEKLLPGAYISEGYYEAVVPGYLNDYEWNHLDQWHRPYIHNSYHESMRVVTGRDFAMSVTKLGNLPILIQVSDVRLSHNLYYQFYVFFGLIYVHQVSRLKELDGQVSTKCTWYTASHKFLWFLHGFLNRKMLQLQKKQEAEDFTIRTRRYEMRKQGFRFKTDKPDFINSNFLTDNVIIPKQSEPLQTSISHLQEGEITPVEIGLIKFLIKKEGEGFFIWPSTCPHEGAVMPKEKICAGIIHCPWHGRKFSAVFLSAAGRVTFKYIDMTITLKNGSFHMQETTTEKATQDFESILTPPSFM